MWKLELLMFGGLEGTWSIYGLELDGEREG